MFRLFLAGCLLLACTSQAPAAIVVFQLSGNGGVGLTGGSENPGVVGGGSGGAINTGIFLDDITNQLTINVGWGSGNGFTDLTGDVIGIHIHDAGPTDPLNTNGGVEINLGAMGGLDADFASGTYVNTIGLTPGQVSELLTPDRYYINVHTAANPGGEIRGALSAVPEPSGLAAVGLTFGVLLRRRQRKS